MNRYIKTIYTYWKMSLSTQLIFRSSALIGSVYAFLFLAANFLLIKVYFSHSNSLAGWSEGEMLILMGSFQIMTTLFDTIFLWAQDSLPEDIIEGNLDYYLIKPMPSLFLLNVRDIYIPGFINLPIPIIMLVLGLEQTGIEVNLMTSLLYLESIIVGTLFMFLVTQIILTFSFWVEGLTSIWMISEELMLLGSRPKEVYSKALKIAFGQVFPLLVVLNLPADVLRQTATSQALYIGLITIFVLFIFMLFQWKMGLKKYQSASS